MSICLCVWLRVCCLRRCASFDLNSYPTAYYRVCRSYSTDCSRLKHLNFSGLQTTGALSFQQWHALTFKWNPCLSVTARVNLGVGETDDPNLTFVLFVKNWSLEGLAQRYPHRRSEVAEISAARLEIWAMHYGGELWRVCRTNLLKLSLISLRNNIWTKWTNFLATNEPF